MQYVVLQKLESIFMNSFVKLKIKFRVQTITDIWS